jgi:undecaprenyl diphosphate synthase
MRTTRPAHVAIAMDGNGRWATARGLPRPAGHRCGATAVRRAVEAARAEGIDVLTLYAFSSDNWRRPRAEVDGLMALFVDYLRDETARCVDADIRLTMIGRRDRLAPSLRRAAEAAERATAAGTRLHLRLAIDYSSREAIWLAAERMIRAGRSSREEFAARIRSGRGEIADVPDVDLLIRTGGEKRLSDFLLWECAYAELHFVEVAWPDFAAEHFADALDAFAGRERRFGGVNVAAGLPPSHKATADHRSLGGGGQPCGNRRA